MSLYRKPGGNHRYLFNKMQYNYECCGVNNFTDWFSVQQTTNELLFVQRDITEFTDEPISPVSDEVPWSCCKKGSASC